MPIPFALIPEPVPVRATPTARLQPAALRGSRMFPSAVLASLAAITLYAALALVLPTVFPARPVIVVDPGWTNPHPTLAPPDLAPPPTPGAPQRLQPPVPPEPIPSLDPADQGTFVPSADVPEEARSPAGHAAEPRAAPGGGDAAVAPDGPAPAPHDVLEYWEDPPSVRTEVKPVYPQIAIDAGVSGTVTLRVLVGVDGRVEDVRVLDGIPLLNGAAMDAARRWRFEPARVSGRPVRVWVALPIRFRLH